MNAVAQLYPGGFYAFAHLFAGPDITHSIRIMRIANATLAALALAWILAVTPVFLRTATVIAVTVVWIPLGLSIVPSTNPSSWALTGLLLLAVMAIGALIGPTARVRWLSLLGAAEGAFMAIASRVDAAAYVMITIAVACTYAGWTRLRVEPLAAGMLSALGLWGALAFLTGSPPVPTQADAALGTAEPGLGLLVTNVALLPGYLYGSVGGWALSWNDAFVLVPLAFLQVNGLGVGEVVQPRYVTPLLLLTVLVLALPTKTEDPSPVTWASTPLRWTLILGLSASALLSWWFVSHRFAYGNTAPLFDAETLRPYALALVVVGLAGFLWIATSWTMDRHSADDRMPVEEGR